MRQSQIFWALLVFWALLFFGALPIARMVEPTGDGFVRGMNRLLLFFQLQAGAAVLALIIWGLGRQLGNGAAIRWARRVPLIGVLVLVLGLAGVILWAGYSKPAPPPPPPLPATQPATE